MSKRTHLIISIVTAVGFVISVQLFAWPEPNLLRLSAAFIVYLLAVSIYNRRYLMASGDFRFWIWLRIPLLLISWFGLFFLVPDHLARSIFLLFTVPIVFFFEYQLGYTGQQLSWNQFLLTLGAIVVSLFGLSFYFLLPGVFFMSLVFVSVTAAIRSSFELAPHESSVKWLASLSLGLFATELFWVTNFLPFHYSALAVTVMVALYTGWVLYYHYLYKTLTLKQIQFHILLATALIGIMLLSTPWGIQT